MKQGFFFSLIYVVVLAVSVEYAYYKKCKRAGPKAAGPGVLGKLIMEALPFGLVLLIPSLIVARLRPNTEMVPASFGLITVGAFLYLLAMMVLRYWQLAVDYLVASVTFRTHALLSQLPVPSDADVPHFNLQADEQSLADVDVRIFNADKVSEKRSRRQSIMTTLCVVSGVAGLMAMMGGLALPTLPH